MPGWTNVWTMPIQNRVDMLATGVNTPVGVRVLGPDLDDVVAASEAIAAVLKRLPGAVDVVADPIRGKGYLEIRLDRDAGGAAGRARRRRQRRDRDGARRQGRDDDRRGPRAAPGPASATPATFREDEDVGPRDPASRRVGPGPGRPAPVRPARPRSPTSGSSRGRRRSRARTGCSGTTSGSTSGAATRSTSSRRPAGSSPREVELPDGRLRRVDRPVRARGSAPGGR